MKYTKQVEAFVPGYAKHSSQSLSCRKHSYGLLLVVEKKKSSGEQTRSFKNKRRGKKPRKLTSRQQARKTLNHRSQGQVNPLEPPGDPHKTWKTVRVSLYLRHENQKFLVFEHGTCCKYGKQIVENMPFHQKMVSR